MVKFILGVVIGIFIGVLVVAPNPELAERVHEAWDDGRRWVAAFVATVEENADEAADETVEGVGEAVRQ